MLIMFILKSPKNRKKFSEKMYSHMFMIATFESTTLVLRLIRLASECVIAYGSLCFNVPMTVWAQQYFIAHTFLESFLKSYSNFSVILFSLNRLIQVKTNPGCFSKRIHKMSMPKMYSFVSPLAFASVSLNF